MNIVLIIFVFLAILFILFYTTDIKVYLEFDNVSKSNVLKVKVYIFSKIMVFKIKREIEGQNKKQGIKEKLEMFFNYLIKSRADPVDFVKKEVKKSPFVPNIIKRFDFSKVYLEKMKLELCLDLNNAAFSAIGTGAINAIISMVTTKYADNIDEPINYRVFPGYTGNGIKIAVSAKIRVKMIEVIKLLLKRGGNKNE